VLSLLEQTNIQDRSALDILVQTWSENAEVFQGFWPSRISNLALSQLYASERPSLQNLMVKGDIIVKPETQNGEFLRHSIMLSPSFLDRSSHHDTVANETKYDEWHLYTS
jgi:importin-9